MKRGTPDHPKLLALCAILNIKRYEAVGILEMLWHFTTRYAPQGDIGKHSDDAIARAVGWERPTGTKGVTPGCRLSEALVDAKWLDRSKAHRLIVHDWESHADQTLKRFIASNKLAFVKPDASLPLPIPEPIPQPQPMAAIPPLSPSLPLTEYPKTHAAVCSHFQSSDGMIVMRIVDSATQAFISVDHPKIPRPGDSEIAEAVEAAFAESKRQNSAALFCKTVPAVISNWATHGRVNGKDSWGSAPLRPYVKPTKPAEIA